MRLGRRCSVALCAATFVAVSAATWARVASRGCWLRCAVTDVGLLTDDHRVFVVRGTVYGHSDAQEVALRAVSSDVGTVLGSTRCAHVGPGETVEFTVAVRRGASGHAAFALTYRAGAIVCRTQVSVPERALR